MGARTGLRVARALAPGLVTLLAGCGPLQTETRVEHGPTLRTFEREGSASPGGVVAQASAEWPRLELTFNAYEVCRSDKVEEYLEARTTEVTSPSLGPALGTGVTTTLLGAGLLLASNLFSNQPDTHTIDATGHYGASPRQIARGWSIPLLVVGIPALGVAAVEWVRTGERTENRKVEQVVSSLDHPCHPKPASGKLTLEGGKAPPAPLEVKEGKLELTPELVLALDAGALALEGREVALSAADIGTVEAFRACARALPVPSAETLATLNPLALADRAEAAGQCRKVPGAPAAEAARVYEQELSARRERGEASAKGPHPERFEDALAAYAPRLQLTPDSPDLEKLQQPEQISGQAARVQGILIQWVEPNIAAVEVGSVRVWLFVEGRKEGELSPGTRVEAVAVIAGRQRLGPLELPLLRAVWLRPAM